MGTRTIVISGTEFKREYEARVYVPDPVGHEPETAYNTRVNLYLNQKYGIGAWHDPITTTASRSMIQSLEIAEYTQPRRGQLYKLRKRAERSLANLNKFTTQKR